MKRKITQVSELVTDRDRDVVTFGYKEGYKAAFEEIHIPETPEKTEADPLVKYFGWFIIIVWAYFTAHLLLWIF